MENKDYNVSETPDQWVIVKIEESGYLSSSPGPLYKIFGSWFGGYLDGDRWKINSGITKVEEQGDYYYFFGYSGSCYKCHKKGYGTGTSYTSGVLQNVIDTIEKRDDGSMISVLPEENINDIVKLYR